MITSRLALHSQSYALCSISKYLTMLLQFNHSACSSVDINYSERVSNGSDTIQCTWTVAKTCTKRLTLYDNKSALWLQPAGH